MILPHFIVFEGIDGTGTSTQIKLLRQRIVQEAPECAANMLITAEPTSGQVGRFLRQVLKGDQKIHPGTAAYLFAADRHEHLYGENGIVQYSKQKKLIITDRYLFSSLAYQSIECGIELPAALNSRFPLPEVVFFFDIDPETAMRRISRRNTTEIYENLPFLEKTAAAYRSVITDYENQHGNEGMRVIRIQAEDSIPNIAAKIWNIVSNLPIIKL